MGGRGLALSELPLTAVIFCFGASLSGGGVALREAARFLVGTGGGGGQFFSTVFM